jgi:DNA-binding transcriptional LysR family regulator
VERHEIEAFLTLAEELHFGRTAARAREHRADQPDDPQARAPRRRSAVRRTSRSVSLTAVGRQLDDDLRPAYARVQEAFRRAVDAGRGLAGVPRAGFVGAAAGQLLVGASDSFSRRHPGCQVLMREVQTGEAPARLRAGHVDVLLACLPLPEPDR